MGQCVVSDFTAQGFAEFSKGVGCGHTNKLGLAQPVEPRLKA